jgi:hypothetical protein
MRADWLNFLLELDKRGRLQKKSSLTQKCSTSGRGATFSFLEKIRKSYHLLLFTTTQIPITKLFEDRIDNFKTTEH